MSLPDCPAPSGGTATYIERAGVRLRCAKWPAADGTMLRGTVFLLHGRTEFIEKYYEVIADFRARGFAVLTFDWRGQGLSTRELADWQRGHVASFNDFLDDFKAIVQSDFAADMPRPWVIVSHSMGGPVALRYLQQDSTTFARAIFSAPMLAMPKVMPAPLYHGLLFAAMALGRGSKQPFANKPVDPAEQRFEDNPVTSDRARFECARSFIRAEPRLAVSGLSWSWVNAATKFLGEMSLPLNMEAIETPCLLVTAEHEKLVDPLGAERLAKQSAHCDALRIDGALHELMMEQDVYRDQFFAAFDSFVASL